MADKDLEFIETSRLLREIQRRMDAMVFVGSSNRTGSEDSILFAVCGPIPWCLGLLETGKIMTLTAGVEDDDVVD